MTVRESGRDSSLTVIMRSDCYGEEVVEGNVEAIRHTAEPSVLELCKPPLRSRMERPAFDLGPV